jgi:hypothetical protein
MKTTTVALILGAVGCLLALIALLVSGPKSGRAEAEDYPIGQTMGDMQRFAEKLYFAGEARNWHLAAFYLHEIEETSEEIINANVVDEGVAVSSFMRQMFPPAIARMQEALRTQQPDQFRPAYESMLVSCNACHQSTGHAFVKIIVPTQPTYQNQDFRP